MTHGHVCADLTIYGNGAYVSSGEHDFELDTYDDEAGHTVGEFLTQDVGLTIYDLNGCAVWSQRNSAHTLNITLENCKNMNRVYLSGTSGTNNITLKNCSFDGTRTDALKAGSCTIYSNASGSITVENCTFTGVKEGINLNHEVTGGGTQTITVTNCAFTDCSTTDICVDDKLYAAPIRIVSKYNATSNLTVENCTFTYSDGKETCNGDILLGEGRVNKVSTPVTATLINTAVQIQIQNPGDRTEEQNKGRQIQVAASAEPTTISSAVAQIGEQKYATLAAALEAAGAMSGDVTVTLLADVDVSGSAVRAYDLSASALTGLTIRGASKDVQIISGVDGNNIDGPTYCPVLTVKLPGEGTFTVENLTFPDDLLFDGASENSVVVQNCVFNGSQSGYPKAKSIFYLNNLFEFKGTAGSFYTNNAYPVWYKSERDQSIVFNGNTVKGYRGVHIETRADDASGHKVNIEVNNNRFELTDTEYENKEVALQLVRAVNGNISFQNNYVDGYMAVCFFKDIKYFDGTATIQNNYLVGNCKLYGSSEWNADGATPEEKENNADSFAQAFLASMGANGTVSEGHTHNYVNGVCTICGQSQPSSGGGSSSGSSGNKTETTTNPDGSTTTTVTKPDGTVTETTTNTDGSKEVVETKKDGTVTTTVTDKAGNKTETVEKTDGSSTTTVDNKDGSSSTTSVSKDGQVEAEVNLPASVVDNAQEEGEPVALPMPEVPVTTDKDSAPTVTVDLPANTTAKVEIPVEDVTYGTVAIRVKADGTEEIIKTTLTTENGVAVTLADGETVKIVDNAKDFVDVPDTYWGSAFVDFATSRGLFSGTSATTFSPDLAMNRAMIVTVLAAYDGTGTPPVSSGPWKTVCPTAPIWRAPSPVSSWRLCCGATPAVPRPPPTSAATLTLTPSASGHWTP